MADENGTEILGFRTSDDWTASDIALFASSVASLYDALLTRRVRRRLQDQYVRSTELAMLRYAETLDHPYFEELLHRSLALA